MARIRSIKPGFWTDEKLAMLPPFARLTFLGLISAMADDEGRCKGDPRLVRAAIWPLDDEVSTAGVSEHLAMLAAAGRIVRYVVDGAAYIEIVNWKRHQRIDKPRPSEIPAPPEKAGTLPDPSPTPPRTLREQSTLDVEVEVEVEGSGIGNGAGAEPEASAPYRSHVGLTKPALDFLGMFYEPALTEKQRDRYRNVCGQIWDTIDAKHPGPKIRGGARVKARSVDHLERECKAVMKDPPMDRDMAIVFLLKRLTNPEPGPTVSERIKEQEAATAAEQERYFAEARVAGAAWAREHPAEYAPIAASANATYRDADANSFAKLARDSELVQACSRAAGFPDFDTWRNGRRESAA